MGIMFRVLYLMVFLMATHSAKAQTNIEKDAELGFPERSSKSSQLALQYCALQAGMSGIPSTNARALSDSCPTRIANYVSDCSAAHPMNAELCQLAAQVEMSIGSKMASPANLDRKDPFFDFAFCVRFGINLGDQERLASLSPQQKISFCGTKSDNLSQYCKEAERTETECNGLKLAIAKLAPWIQPEAK